MDKQVFLEQDMESFGNIPRHGMVGSCGRSISSYLRTPHTGFSSGCTRFISANRERIFFPEFTELAILKNLT